VSATLENVPVKYEDLILDIQRGQVKIPQFQRKFVWTLQASAKLLDSIMKGYPIGTFIYWRTNDRLRSIRNLGNIDSPEPKNGDFINYVLDGQQRLTSLFAALKGIVIQDDDGNATDYSLIYVDLEAGDDDEVIITDIDGRDNTEVIKLTDLMENDFTRLAKYPQKYFNKLQQYQKTLQGYAFSVINLKNAEIDVATEVFTRLNVGGRALTLFEIMVAKTYHVYPDNSEENSHIFDLSERYEELSEELSSRHYDNISTATILQVVAILLDGDCTRRNILKIDKMRFIEIWDEAVDCIKRTIDFFRSYGISVSRILPYNSLIVPFSYYFHKQKSNPVGETKRLIEDFFWRVSLGFRYSSGVESKLAQDIKKIDKIIKGIQPQYEWSVQIDKDFVKSHGWFSTGKSFIKAVLCLYAKHKPKSFNSNLEVILDNSWLKIATSKNYHHFFPKSWMHKKMTNIEQHRVNHIANITIVDDYLNKNEIKATSPREYMKKYLKQNPKLAITMKSHLVDIERDGIWDNDFETFFENRVGRIVKELNKFIIKQDSEGDALEEYSDKDEDDDFE